MRECTTCGETFDPSSERAVRTRLHFNALATTCPECADPAGMFAPRAPPRPPPARAEAPVVRWDEGLVDLVPARTELECRWVTAEIARVVAPRGLRAYYWDRMESVVVENEATRQIQGVWAWTGRALVRSRR